MSLKEVTGKTPRGIVFSKSSSPTSKDVLVLVMGYAGGRKTWPRRFIQNLSERFHTITMDNRGTGESIKPQNPESYTVQEMSADLKSVVDEAGIKEFHLLGYSLGGCIAQDFARQYPSNVKSLTLMSTTAGGAMYVSPLKEVMDAIANPKGDTVWDLYLATWRQCLSEESIRIHHDVLNEIFESSIQNMTPRFAMKGHLHAYRYFDSTEFLNQMKMPVLIVSGKDDKLTPLENSRKLFEKLPHAKFMIIPDCEHAPHIEREQELLQGLFSFMNL